MNMIFFPKLCCLIDHNVSLQSDKIIKQRSVTCVSINNPYRLWLGSIIKKNNSVSMFGLILRKAALRTQITPIKPDETKLKCPSLMNAACLGGRRQHGRAPQ